MAKKKDNQGEREVMRMPLRPHVTTGRPTDQKKLVLGSMRAQARTAGVGYRAKVAAGCGVGGGGFGGAAGGGAGAGFGVGDTIGASAGNFYSPELSTDFLELPQSVNEQWNYYRFFYRNEPFVGQAIDLHTELPLSKIRLAPAPAKDGELSRQSLEFCDQWAERIGLLEKLQEIVHEFHLIGEAFIWCEDGSPDMPKEVTHDVINKVLDNGDLVEEWVERPDANERAVAWLEKHYKGWTGIRCLPPEQVHIETFPFTNEVIMELIPDAKSKHVLEIAQSGDPRAQRVVDSMDPTIIRALTEGENIPLNTDPDAGSFVHYMANKRSSYEPRGHSILQRCLLPGTQMTVLRDETVIQVSVEDVNTETDLLLTHKGRFRKAQAGSRPIQEDIAILHVEGMDSPLRLTKDHEVLVVRDDGTETWKEAGDLQEGDLLRESHVVPEKSALREIDLAEWWAGRSFVVNRRVRSPRASEERGVRVADVRVSERLFVTLEYDNDDAGQVGAVEGMRKFAEWLKALPGPTEATYQDISEATGVTTSKLKNYASLFRKAGLHTETCSLGRGHGRKTTWFPLQEGTPLPREVCQAKISSPVSKITVDPDFCYLVGTWVGDGNIWTSREKVLNAHSLAWTAGKGDLEQKIKDVQMQLAARYLGDQVTGGHLFSGPHDVDAFRVEDPLLARWFMEEFGHTAQGKKLPSWFFDLDEDCILGFLQGLLDTDGCLQESSSQTTIRFEMDNRALLEQVHLLCNRLGIKSTVRNYTRSARTWDRSWETQHGTRKKTYSYEAKTYPNLIVTRYQDVCRWAKGSVKGSCVEWVEKSHPNAVSHKFVEGWLTRRVRRVELAPYEGFVYSFDVEGDNSHVTNGVVTHNCMRIIVYFDKLRQAQTSIASRHMTPIRLVYAENMDEADTEALRDQIDLALQDPDYSIVTNFQVVWEEMNSNGRILELSGEYDLVTRQLYAGLGVTESLLSGESSYSGDRINLEVINTRYMLLREKIQRFVQEQIFKPMCKRMGFIETDDYGNEQVIYPRVTFTRLALRDNQETFDALFNLYQKGSLDIETIYDTLGLDANLIADRLRRDTMTVNDAQFNRVLEGMYSRLGDQLAENTDAVQKIAERLGLQYVAPKEEEAGRF